MNYENFPWSFDSANKEIKHILTPWCNNSNLIARLHVDGIFPCVGISGSYFTSIWENKKFKISNKLKYSYFCIPALLSGKKIIKNSNDLEKIKLKIDQQLISFKFKLINSDEELKKYQILL
jgi:hypothetical protein